MGHSQYEHVMILINIHNTVEVKVIGHDGMTDL